MRKKVGVFNSERVSPDRLLGVTDNGWAKAVRVTCLVGESAVMDGKESAERQLPDANIRQAPGEHVVITRHRSV